MHTVKYTITISNETFKFPVQTWVLFVGTVTCRLYIPTCANFPSWDVTKIIINRFIKLLHPSPILRIGQYIAHWPVRLLDNQRQIYTVSSYRYVGVPGARSVRHALYCVLQQFVMRASACQTSQTSTPPANACERILRLSSPARYPRIFHSKSFRRVAKQVQT